MSRYSQPRRSRISKNRRYDDRMCRNIRILHNFEPPTTPEEIRDAVDPESRHLPRLCQGAWTPTPTRTRARGLPDGHVPRRESTMGGVALARRALPILGLHARTCVSIRCDALSARGAAAVRARN